MSELDLKRIVNDIKDRKAISISYIVRNYSVGFTKGNQIFKELIDGGYISTEGKVLNKCKADNAGINVVFLDVDGVLNCSSTKDMCLRYVGIEDEKVSLLKQIVDKSKAKIVLISTWKEWWFNTSYLKDKQDFLANYLDMKLAKQGLSIYDKTEDELFNRGDGILEYIRHLSWKGINVNNYVVLDDEIFDYKRTRITKNLVQTSYNNGGLQRKHVGKALEKLNVGVC